MRVLLLNGAKAGDRPIAEFAAAEQRLLEALGAHVTRYDLADERLAFCQGCFECWTKTPGLCKTNDSANDISRDYVASDVALFVTPISFGGYGSELKKALDRAIGIMLPSFRTVAGETHHAPRYAHYPALLVVGFADRADEEQALVFRRLVARNALNFAAPAYGCRIVPDETADAAAVARAALDLGRCNGSM